MKRAIKNAKELKKVTKRQMIRDKKREDKKRWQDTRQVVLARDSNLCAICQQPHDRMNVHHLMDRKSYQNIAYEPMNLISVCPKHHKFGNLSFHHNAFWAVNWVKENRPEQYEWIMAYLKELNGGI